MKFSEFLREDAAAGAISTGSVAGARGSLFGSVVSRKPLNNTKIGVIKYKKLANWNGYKKIHEADNASSFSAIDVISKLNAAEKHNDMQKDAVVYGIESDDGSITKVYIAKDQDTEFKRALDSYLQDVHDKKDIAEILFNLRNTFNILHVEWPPIPEDEEVNVEMDKDKQKGDNVDAELPKDGEGGEGG